MTSPPETPAPEPADSETQAKVEHPQDHFEHPAEVVIDPQLSKNEKVHALDTMEQDARQLSVALAEGMPAEGGSGLQDVLVAKESLELSSFALATSVFLQILQAKLREATQADTRATIARAIEAVEAVSSAIGRADAAG